MKLCTLYALVLILAGVCVAQQPGPSGGVVPPPSVVVTGCLEKGQEAGEFFLKTEDGQKVRVESKDDLQRHVDHRIRITGIRAKQDEKAILRADLVEHVANSCQ